MTMFDLIFNTDDSFFLGKQLALQGNEVKLKFRIAIHPQAIRQFHDNCQIAKCQTFATLAPV